MVRNIFESLDKQLESMESSALTEKSNKRFNAFDFKQNKYFPLYVVDDTDMDVIEANDFFGGFIDNMAYDVNPELDWFDLGLEYGEQGGTQIFVRLKPDENNYGDTETVAIGDISWDLDSILGYDDVAEHINELSYPDDKKQRLLDELAQKQKQIREEIDYINKDVLPKLAKDWGFSKIAGPRSGSMRESSKSKYIFDRRKLSESCRNCSKEYAEKAFNAGSTIYVSNGTKSARVFTRGSECPTFNKIEESFKNKDHLSYIVDTKTVKKSLNESVDKRGRNRYNGGEKCLKESFYKHDKERSTIKESRKPLNEGPGAGYEISATVKVHTVKGAKVTDLLEWKTEYSSYGDTDFLSAVFNIDCDADCDIENLEFNSYNYGDKLDGAYTGKISKMQVGVYADLHEYGVENAENWSDQDVIDFINDHITVIDDSFRNEHFNTDVVYGGGWSHSTYDGTISTMGENDWVAYSNSSYNEMECEIDKAEIKLTDNQVIEFIDRTVTGDTQSEQYIVRSWDDDIIEQFDTVEEAKKWVRENGPNSDAAYIEVEYMQQDLNGDWDTTRTDIVWDLRTTEDDDDFSEDEEIPLF